jgi:deazaflavin-dependent oxidoreductase (nitroreductase family)
MDLGTFSTGDGDGHDSGWRQADTGRYSMSGSRKWPLRLGLAASGIMVLALVFDRALSFVLRTKRERELQIARKFVGHSLNPVLLWFTDRFHIDQPVVYHIGRRSGREYATPLCVSATPAGYIVPVAFGPDVDWLANLRKTPRTRLSYGGKNHHVIAEVIDADEAIRLAGGSPACSCWEEYRVEEFVLLRPVESGPADDRYTIPVLTGVPVTSPGT